MAVIPPLIRPVGRLPKIHSHDCICVMNLLRGNRPPKYLLFLLFGISSLLLLLGNNALILYSLDEVRNAQCAREMWQGGDWIVPTFNGELRVQKPPLHYAFMATAYSFLGENPFAARFFSGIMGALLIVITFYWAWTRFNATVAWITAGGLLGSAHFHLLFRMAVPDPYLIVLFTASIFSLYKGRIQNNRWIIYAGYFLVGLSCLTKGPVAAWLAGLTIILYELIFLRIHKPKVLFKSLFSWKPIEGIIIVLGVASPWFLLVHDATNGVWTRYFFFQQNLERFNSPMEGHGGGPLITLLYLVVGILPLSIFLPQSIPFWIKQRFSPDIRILLSASLAVLLTFLLASTRLITYTAPAYPFLSILFGLYISHQLKNGWNKWIWINYAVWLVVFVGLVVGAYIGLGHEPLAAHASPFSIILILLPFSTLLFLMIFRKKPHVAAIIWILLFQICCILGFSILYPRIYKHNPVSESLPLIGKNENVFGFGRVNPAFIFPLNRTIAEERNLDVLWKQLLKTDSAIVISSTEYLGELECLPKGSLREVLRAKYIFERPTAVIFKWSRPDSLQDSQNNTSLYNWVYPNSAILTDKPGSLAYTRKQIIAR